MRARGNRQSVILGTKGGHPHLETMHIPRLSPTDIASDLEDSLRNLGTDHVDLYWLHRDDPQRPVGEIIETLNQHVAQGKIRYFGCSNWSTRRMQDARAYCQERGVPGFVASQVMWNLAQPNETAFGFPGMVGMDDEMRTFHARTGLAAVPYNAQASGLFSKALQADFGRSPAYEEIRAKYLNPTTLRRIERVQRFAAERGLEPTQVGVAFLMSHSFVTVPVVGPRNPAQLASSLGAIEITLTERDIAWLTG
jgi:aryl-alcohol dehydrogenase-like predicted oxidoreductase